MRGPRRASCYPVAALGPYCPYGHSLAPEGLISEALSATTLREYTF